MRKLLNVRTGTCSNHTDVPLWSRRRGGDGSETEQRVRAVHRANLPEAAGRVNSYPNDRVSGESDHLVASFSLVMRHQSRSISAMSLVTLNCAQEVLMRRMGNTAHVVNLKLNPPVPPSVRLLPAKQYTGAAIGISYDLRIFIGKYQHNRHTLEGIFLWTSS